jgi:hypothetical protein
MQIINHFIVHSAAKLRMRVQHNGDGGVFGFLRVVTAFEAAFWAWKYHFGHVVPLVCFGSTLA